MNRPIHFEILADEPQKIVAFYEAVLDWQIAPWQGGPEPYWLITTGEAGTPGMDGAIMHRSFPQATINTVQVEALQPVLEKVEAAGGKLVLGPNEVPGVGTHAYCSDPEGNLFGLLQPLME